MWLRCSALLLIWAGLGGGCQPSSLAADPQVPGDDPSMNPATTRPIDGVPYCPGGKRASACLLGADCRVTEAGCQVCQCASPK